MVVSAATARMWAKSGRYSEEQHCAVIKPSNINEVVARRQFITLGIAGNLLPVGAPRPGVWVWFFDPAGGCGPWRLDVPHAGWSWLKELRRCS
jgi:hypothetical protein